VGPGSGCAHECNEFSARSLARRHTLFDISVRPSRAESFTFEPSYSTPARSPSPLLIPEPSQFAELLATAARIPPIEQELYFTRDAICPPPDSDDALAAEYTELRFPIPQDYHNLLGVLSKQKRTTLPPRCPQTTISTLGPHYSVRSDRLPLRNLEQLALRGFLDENLNNQFIRPSQSSTGPPVLFIRKEDRSLRLVDDLGLNNSPKMIGVRSHLSLI